MSEFTSTLRPERPAHSPAAALEVELVGDLVCPFCFLGKRRLDVAMRSVHGPRSLAWYPYQLNPTMPDDGEPIDTYLGRRFGSRDAIQPVLDRLSEEGREVGIEYRFDRLTRVPNTLAAQQLIHAAAGERLDTMALADDVMAGFLTRGEDIGSTDVLVDIAARHGLSGEQVRDAVTDESARSAVLGQEALVRNSGLSGVPGILMNRRLLLVGVQDVDSIVTGFDRAMFGDESGNEIDGVLH